MLGTDDATASAAAAADDDDDDDDDVKTDSSTGTIRNRLEVEGTVRVGLDDVNLYASARAIKTRRRMHLIFCNACYAAAAMRR